LLAGLTRSEIVCHGGSRWASLWQKYAATASYLSDVDLLNKLHLQPKSQIYLDVGNHTEKVRLVSHQYVDHRNWLMTDSLRVVEAMPKVRWVPHYGYNSIFPLMLKLLPPESEELGVQLRHLENSTLLWTDFGLRSLATTSSLYMHKNTEHDAPYWRGPVWINLNYLTLAALHHYSQASESHTHHCTELYSRLRLNLIRNIVRRYRESGYLWEQYDNVNDGKGKGSHPFTGWTALIVLIMAEIYP